MPTSTATSAVTWIIGADLGAMAHGAETLKLGAMGCGADLQGPNAENISPGVYL